MATSCLHLKIHFLLFCRTYSHRITSFISLLQERQEAKKLFATENGQPAEDTPPPAKTFVPGEIPSDDLPENEEIPAEVEEPSRKGPTPEQIIAIKVMFEYKACLLVSSNGLYLHKVYALAVRVGDTSFVLYHLCFIVV